MRKAVIDIGSNSIKLAIGEKEKGDVKIIEFLKNIVPLGKSTFYKERISQEGINQTVMILKKYKDVLGEYAVSKTKVIATTAIREARNRDVFLDTIYRKTGFEVEILDVGSVVYYLDSFLTYRLKNKFPIHSEKVLIAELGTGSLDISGMDKGLTVFNMGLPLGTLRLMKLVNRLSGSIDESQEAMEEHISNEFGYLRRELSGNKLDDIILIDENYAPYLSKIIKRTGSRENFFKFSYDESKKLIKKLRGKTIEEIMDDFDIPFEIAETISAYTFILREFCSMAKKKHIHTLDVSLSKAVLANILLKIKFTKNYDNIHQLVSQCKYLCGKYSIDVKHSEYVSYLSDIFFDKLKDFLGLKKNQKEYLVVASYLHDIGSYIYNRAHHKHTEYILRFLNLIRLDEREKKVIACVARYHRRARPRESHPVFTSLSSEDRLLVQKLSSILRMTTALDCSHKQKAKKIEIDQKEDMDFTLTVQTSKNFSLEISEFLEKKKLFEEITGSSIDINVH